MIRTNSLPSSHQYDDNLSLLMEEIFKTNGFLIVNKTVIKVLGLIPAILLGNYIETAKNYTQSHPENEGWFFMTQETISEELQLGISIVRKYKQELIDKRILITKLKGVPPKEWLKINMYELYQLLQPPKNGKDTKIKPLKIRKSNLYVNNNNLLFTFNKDIFVGNKIHQQTSQKKLSLKERNSQYLPLAKYLAKIIRIKKNIQHTTVQLNGWANEIRQLSETNGVDIPRIRAVLTWYEKNIGGEYIPVIESGRSLREKFTRLEAAIERENCDFSRKQSSPKIVEAFGEKWYQKEDGFYYNDTGDMLRN